jgi:hypothetical protein
MTDYNINAVTRKTSFSGSAGVGPYAFTFEILDETDIAVYRNTTLLILTSDYTVTINANGTGSVTLTTAATASDTIIIIGARDIERTTDFVTAGDLRASALNEQLDSLTIFDQQLSERIDRSLAAPPFDPININMTLPGVEDRKGKFLQFNSSTGNPEVTTSAADVTTLAAVADDIATLADIEDGTVATDSIQTVATVASQVPTVATNAAAVRAIGDDLNGAAITLDYGDLGTATNPASPTGVIGTIYDNIDTIAALADAADDLATLGTLTTEIEDLGALTTEIEDLGAITADITATAALSSADLSTVAGIAADVTTVAGVTADLTNVTNNLVAIQNADQNAQDAETALTDFKAIYVGAASSAPSTDGNGDALTAGDLYYDTTANQLYVWDGSAWDEAAFNATGAVTSFNTRVGAVTLTSGDVTTALGFTPEEDLGYTPADIAGDTFTGDVFGTNLTLSGYLRGPSSFTIDPATHGDDTGTLIIAGNLQVDGTTTTINSTTLDVDDLNITVAKGAADGAAANGAGLTIDGASVSFTYDNANTRMALDTGLNVTGTLSEGGSAVLKSSDIGSTVQAYDADTAKLDVAQEFTATQTFSGDLSITSTASINEVIEKCTIDNSTTGTLNFDALTQAVVLLDTDQTADRTINFRGDSSNSLDSIMAVGESMTFAVLATQGSTAYYFSAVQIDGSAVTPNWQGGSAPTEGNADSIDSYSFSIIKTASATFTVLASQTQFA